MSTLEVLMKEEDIRRIVNEELDKRLTAAIDQLIVGDAETPATTDAGVRRLTQAAVRAAVRSLQR